MGPIQAQETIGDITESVHRFLLDGWQDEASATPRIEENLSFVPKDREKVIYVYMYRASENTALKNPKRFAPVPFSLPDSDGGPEYGGTDVLYEWPPIFVDVFYLVAAHAKFRSDAERLLGWTIMRLHQATHLLYRPRRYVTPSGDVLDSMGQPWSADKMGDGIAMEKVSLALVDDLTVGDAINFFTIHEAPYRPYVTYRARCALRGALVSAPPTTVRALPLETVERPRSPAERSNGRLGRIPTRPTRKPPIGPEGHDIRPIEDDNDQEG